MTINLITNVMTLFTHVKTVVVTAHTMQSTLTNALPLLSPKVDRMITVLTMQSTSTNALPLLSPKEDQMIMRTTAVTVPTMQLTSISALLYQRMAQMMEAMPPSQSITTIVATVPTVMIKRVTRSVFLQISHEIWKGGLWGSTLDVWRRLRMARIIRILMGLMILKARGDDVPRGYRVQYNY